MNILDCAVERVLRAPYELNGRWWVEVEYNCWGGLGKTVVMCSSEEEVLKVDKGFEFLA